jgi:nucleotide-binding universal stress UspA family protein
MSPMNNSQPIKHILVAHDFEPDSDAALDYALGLARALGARITLLHTYEIPSMGAPEVLVMATDWTKQIGVVAREALSKVAARVGGAGVPIASEVREGAAWREVQSFVREHGVDLVVVGSHGRRGLSRALLGSVAEKVVRTAPCPVLVVRPSSPPA